MAEIQVAVLELIEKIVDKNNPKMELNYALFDFTNNEIIATDTRRLLKYYINISKDNESYDSLIVHKSTLSRVISAASKHQGIEFSNGQFISEYDSISPVLKENFVYVNTKTLIEDTKKYTKYNIQELDLLIFQLHNLGVHFNLYYLEAIKAFDLEYNDYLSYNIYVDSPKTPFAIEAVNQEGTLVYDYLVMPILMDLEDEEVNDD